jgi:asparagine synthase (glutamine-hydrolysing)
VFKKAYERDLPADVLWRRKQGFEIPIDAWLRGPLRPYFEECVLKPQVAVAPLIDQAVARNLFRSHLSGAGRHGAVLWSLLVLARWSERYLGSSPASVPLST